jgi:branched-chain amino acid transport system ATP-binding protein
MLIWGGNTVSILRIENLTVCYADIPAIKNISINVEEGEIISLIGSNGAGKSTSIKAISGLLGEYGGKITNGNIVFRGDDITNIKTHCLAKYKIAVVPEGKKLFYTMSIEENLLMGAHTIKQATFVKEQILIVLDIFPRLKEKIHQLAASLSGGEQQMLCIGRALMLRPTLLLLDEPSVGLSPNYKDIIFQKLIDINSQGVSIMLVEQNARQAVGISNRAYVFNLGEIVMQGTRQDLFQNESIKKIYLGG